MMVKRNFSQRFHNQRFHSKGFTLIEVMVALLIVGVALSAMLVRIQGFIGSTIYLREKTLASWVALNQLELVKLTNQATYQLLEGEVSGDAEMANRQWVWTINPIETEAQGYQQLQVSVALAEFPEDSLVAITGIIDSHY